MTRVRIVDAFTERAFAGNPAGVVRLDQEPVAPPDGWCPAVAAELNLAETAFVSRAAGPDADFELRWFTPTVEVDLCGHATLAAARCLFDDGVAGPVRFSTRSGILTVRELDGARLQLNFPAQPPVQVAEPDGLSAALGAEIRWLGAGGGDYLAELADAATVRSLQPNLAAIAELPIRGLIVTAASDVAEADFVSRFFGPAVGVAEDPVTGSAHTVLGPYWSTKLARNPLTGLQVSRRGGLVGVRVAGDRVELTGTAVTVLDGRLVGRAALPA